MSVPLAARSESESLADATNQIFARLAGEHQWTSIAAEVLSNTMPTLIPGSSTDTACWLWLGSASTRGYGRIVRAGVTQRVHRVTWEAEHGPIPETLVLDHLCHDHAACRRGVSCLHRRCVNPAHLGLSTHAANSGRTSQARRTCVVGHALSEDNISRDARGRRRCLTCENQLQALGGMVPPPAQVRAWARASGYVVGARGALSRDIVARYLAAHLDGP